MSDTAYGAREDERGGDQPRPRYWLHLALYLCTFASTTLTGMAMGGSGMNPWIAGLAFSVPLMAILTCHELGHYVAARVHGVPASLPYFIPLPPGLGLGTLGAVITQEGTRNRKQLLDIGAAGPLAGLLVAIPVLIYGVHLSEVSAPVLDTASGKTLLQEGNSILYGVVKFMAKGAWLPGGGLDVNLHPTGMAGWAGLLLTMINLLPIGQFDGGHIATAYFGNRYARVARVVHRSLPWVGLLAFGMALRAVEREAAGRVLADEISPTAIALGAATPWFLWFGLAWLLGRISGGFDHPEVDAAPLPRSRAALFWVVAAAFVLIFMPVPFRAGLGAAPPAPAPTSSGTSR
jgi:membrane-associated protease RseP (regulator of RpoE activity)